MRWKIDSSCADSEMEEIEEAIVSTQEEVIEDGRGVGGAVRGRGRRRERWVGMRVERGGRRGRGRDVERAEVSLWTTCWDLREGGEAEESSQATESRGRDLAHCASLHRERRGSGRGRGSSRGLLLGGADEGPELEMSLSCGAKDICQTVVIFVQITWSAQHTEYRRGRVGKQVKRREMERRERRGGTEGRADWQTVGKDTKWVKRLEGECHCNMELAPIELLFGSIEADRQANKHRDGGGGSEFCSAREEKEGGTENKGDLPDAKCVVIVTANSTDILRIIAKANRTDTSLKESFAKSTDESSWRDRDSVGMTEARLRSRGRETRAIPNTNERSSAKLSCGDKTKRVRSKRDASDVIVVTTEALLGVGGEIMNDAKSSSGVDDFFMAILLLFLSVAIPIPVFDRVDRLRVSIERTTRVEIGLQSEDILSKRRERVRMDRERDWWGRTNLSQS
jgi:hypothetical protein